MVKVEIDGKTYNVPSEWKDITMEDYSHAFWNLEKVDDSMDEKQKEVVTDRNMGVIASRLLGEKDDFLMDKPLGLFVRISEIIGFIYSIDTFLMNNEYHLTINGKKYYMPSPEDMSLRQYIDCDEIMKNDNNPKQFIELLAALLVTFNVKKGMLYYDGSYEERMDAIANLPASEGLPFIYTFFKKKVLFSKVMEAYSKVEAANPQHHST